MKTRLERDVVAARSRAAAATARANASAARSERFARLAVDGSPSLHDLHLRLAEAERASGERHLASARMHEAWADRLELWALQGSEQGESPTLAGAVADCVGVESLAVTVWSVGGAVAALIGTDDRARRAQDLEFVLGSGPSHASATSHRPVRAPAEVLTAQWPEYSTLAAGFGVDRVSVVPLQLSATLVGSLSVFDTAFTEQVADLDPLQRAADAYVEEILSQVESDPATPPAGLLAGDRAHLLHNAAGRIATDEGCDVASALALIRARAFREDIPAVEVSRQILEGHLRLGDSADGV